jgi:hypothetical protein
MISRYACAAEHQALTAGGYNLVFVISSSMDKG